MNYTSNLRGKASCSFHYGGSEKDIAGESSTIRELVETPDSLTLSLSEIRDNMPIDNPYGINLTLKGIDSESDGVSTAKEVSAFMNQLYNTHLYKPNELFYGDIAYEENGKYVPTD